jgi:hypothetical protein
MPALSSHPRVWSSTVVADPYRHPALQLAEPATAWHWWPPRPVRVALLLIAVGLLNGFDLFSTIVASRLGCFIEANPFAALVLGEGRYLALIVYKAILVLFASAILWRFRHHRFSELGCWLITLLYSAVAIRWHLYYQVFQFYCNADGPTALPNS